MPDETKVISGNKQTHEKGKTNKMVNGQFILHKEVSYAFINSNATTKNINH